MQSEQSFTLAEGHLRRRYVVHAPPGVAEGRPLPVVVMLHGAGATAEWTLDETRWGETADREGFLVVLPEATRADPDRPPDFLRNPQVWNSGPPAVPQGQPGADDVGFIDHVLDDLARRFPVDARRVHLSGFSNGAAMVFRLGAERAARFAALAPVAGHCRVEEPRPEPPRPTLYLVGTNDPLVPLEGGPMVSPWGGSEERPPVAHTLCRWAAALGCPPAPVRRGEDGVQVEEYPPGAAGAALTAYFIDGLGHHWPGGRGLLNRRLAGPTSDRVRANEVLWEFFRPHRA
jgi:polyhydroxybutyrate depolymerase